MQIVHTESGRKRNNVVTATSHCRLSRKYGQKKFASATGSNTCRSTRISSRDPGTIC